MGKKEVNPIVVVLLIVAILGVAVFFYMRAGQPSDTTGATPNPNPKGQGQPGFAPGSGPDTMQPGGAQPVPSQPVPGGPDGPG